MPNFEEDLSVDILINDELKKYTDEDMLWLYDEVGSLKINLNPFELINLTFPSFDYLTDVNCIKNDILNFLLDLDDKELLLDLFNRFKTRKKKHEEDYSHLKQDQRFCLLLINYLQNINLNKKKFEYNQNYFKYAIYNILYRKDTKNKINNLLEEYKLKILPKINKSKNFEDINFLEWSFVYLKEKNEDFEKVEYIPKNKKEHKDLIISFLDFLFYFDKNQHYVLTTQLFKAWSQRKFRDSEKTKNMYHLPLTKNAKDELKKLSQVRGCSENLMLEKLINEAYLKEICDENGVSKY